MFFSVILILNTEKYYILPDFKYFNNTFYCRGSV
jgi:hypothetical protein